MEPEFYDRYARLEDQHWWFRARRDVIRECMDRHVGVGDSTRRILDVGCGTGAMLERVLGRYGTPCGVDSERRAVERARGRGVEAIHVPGVPETPLPFGDGSFDVVSAFDVLEHVDDDIGVGREMARVCRSGGAVVVTAPAFPSLWGQQDIVSHHKRRYTRSGLVRTLTLSGLAFRHATFFNTALFPTVAGIRLLRRTLGSATAADRTRSDFELGPSGRRGSEVLYRIMSAERRPAARIGLPFGVSLLVVCERP
jgi:SAM-dependent methyltransferase